MSRREDALQIAHEHGEVLSWIAEMSAMPQSLVWNMCGPLTGTEMGALLIRWRNAGLVKYTKIGSVRWVWCTAFGNRIVGRAPYGDDAPPTEDTWRHVRSVCLVRAAVESMGGEWLSGRYLRWESENRAAAYTAARTVTTHPPAAPSSHSDSAASASDSAVSGGVASGSADSVVTRPVSAARRRHYPDGIAWLGSRAAGATHPWLVRVDGGTSSESDAGLTSLVTTGGTLGAGTTFSVLYAASPAAFTAAEETIAARPDKNLFRLQRLEELEHEGLKWFRSHSTTPGRSPA
ncbi:hypothetical protein [Pseudonocardia sp. ICBG601]|uniref:hypothetical protein n=1 Tax=Pseudonocardia sp. ICBG601 TaxID=2846759 RepID=UPI001CF67C9F|nr:hypothetical protein [Pseudonocardia sp. ICBG601]